MKKINFMAAAIALLAAGCTKEDIGTDSGTVPMTLTVSTATSGTKAAFGEEAGSRMPVLWQEGDRIAVIENKGTDDQKVSVYVLSSTPGQATGTFSWESGEAFPSVITDVVYPASAVGNNYAVPTSQTYAEGSFDPKAVVMSYHNETAAAGDPIVLKAESSVLRLQLTGNRLVKSVKVTLTDRSDNISSYTLDCPDVALTPVAAPFYLTVPAGDYKSATLVCTSHLDEVMAEKTTTITVPYAAATVVNYPSVDFQGTGHYIGEVFDGGIVYEMAEDYIKLMSLAQSEKIAWSTEEVKTGTEATADYSGEDGFENSSKIQSTANFEGNYPAVNFCLDLGEGWYLPALKEIQAIYANLFDMAKGIIDADTTNRILKDNGSKEIVLTDTNADMCIFWSSNECNLTSSRAPETHAFRVSFTIGKSASPYQGKKTTETNLVRAVKKISLVTPEN